MTPKKQLTPEDQALFEQEMKGVKKHKRSSRYLEKPKPPEKNPKKVHDHPQETPISIKGEWAGSESTLNFSRSGVSWQKLRALKQGKMILDAKLDLHGLTAQEAIHEATAFLQECKRLQYHTLLIVHGKGRQSAGKPILKNVIFDWLKQQKQVLAIHSAQPRHGGTGALYVLLSIK